MKSVFPGNGFPLVGAELKPVWLYLFLGIAPFGLYGFRTEFFLAEHWRTAAVIFGAAPGLLIAAGWIGALRRNFVYGRLSPFALGVALWILIPAMTLFYCGVALGIGLPGAYTRFAGDAHRAVLDIHRTRDRQTDAPGSGCTSSQSSPSRRRTRPDK